MRVMLCRYQLSQLSREKEVLMADTETMFHFLRANAINDPEKYDD